MAKIWALKFWSTHTIFILYKFSFCSYSPCILQHFMPVMLSHEVCNNKIPSVLLRQQSSKVASCKWIFCQVNIMLCKKFSELHGTNGTRKIEYFNWLQLITQLTYNAFYIPGLEIPACWGRLPFIGKEFPNDVD